MAPKGKAQDRPSLSKAHPGTPPKSPVPSSADSVISQDVEQAPNPDNPCSCQLLGNSAIQLSSTPVTPEHFKQLFLKLIERSKSPDSAKQLESPGLSSSTSFTLSDAQLVDLMKAIAPMHTIPNRINPHCHCSQTPLNSPAPQTSSPPVTWEDLKQLFLEVIQAKSELPKDVNLDAQRETDTGRIQALKPEFKKVDEVWDNKSHQYKVVESLKPKDAIGELDHYVFVVRVRIDKDTEKQTSYIDIKSELLRDILRTVLKKVRGINLGEDKPTVEANLLYHYLPELELHQSILDHDSSNDNALSDDDSSNDSSSDSGSSNDGSSGGLNDTPNSDLPKLLNATRKEHFDLLIEHIKTIYTSTMHSLFSLRESKEITYYLLWALFKPRALIYTTCLGSKKPRCVIYDSGEEKKLKSGLEYFYMECRYLDFDGKVFGEASTNILIPRFRGTRRINTLEAFPLEYHSNASSVRANLLECGQKFVSLRGTHHRHCFGIAFFIQKGDPIQFSVDSRFMVDALLFRKLNPNYSRPRVTEPKDTGDASDYWSSRIETEPANLVQIYDRGPAEMKDDDFLICCPTVLGFSFNDKIWAEFPVADIKDIEWSDAPFNCLSIPNGHKDTIMALAETHIGESNNVLFDDFVAGKGRGLIILLHGPPGVGKTLTAEAVSEHLKRPLYSISAGELQVTAAELENQLTRISEMAHRWKALLLLDEADVFVEQRTSQNLVRNGLVSVFLRKLEYCQGIMFLTTNRVTEFDVAIISRIHLMFKYGDLNKVARRQIWEQFIKRACTSKGPAEVKPNKLEDLVMTELNGRQIKNIMAAAHAMATMQKSPVRYSHIETAMAICKNFFSDLNGGVEASKMYH